MKMNTTALFAGLCLLVSCAPSQRDLFNGVSTPQNIINGNTVASDDPIAHSTVQLIRFQDPQTRTLPVLRCSASILSESTILTAAHCMSNDAGEAAVSEIWVYFSDKVPTNNERLPENLLRKVVNGVVHPGWKDSSDKLSNGQNNVDDIGMLSFSGGLPPTFAAVQLVDSGTKLMAQQKIIGAGFGRVGPTTRGLRLLMGTFEVTEPNFAEREFAANDPNKVQFVCQGDSGGPMYIRDSSGQILLAGIISRGVNIFNKLSPQCGTDLYQVFTRVSSYLDWISSESEKLNDDRLEKIRKGSE